MDILYKSMIVLQRKAENTLVLKQKDWKLLKIHRRSVFEKFYYEWFNAYQYNRKLMDENMQSNKLSCNAF